MPGLIECQGGERLATLPLSSPGLAGRSSNRGQALVHLDWDYWMPALAGMTKEAHMVRVVGIDHLVLRVGDYEKSKVFYGKLFDFLGFKVLEEYAEAIGWTNGKTRLWIGPADAKGRKHKYRIGDIGFHHYAFELRSRKDVDALQDFLEKEGVKIVDPAGEYYDDYYAVFFLDPDGMKLEGMKWGERHAKAAHQRAAKKRAASRKRTPAK
jgi:catechol 2,3-dioxygenase-like lactoylglutathione lyase family enzyme